MKQSRNPHRSSLWKPCVLLGLLLAAMVYGTVWYLHKSAQGQFTGTSGFSTVLAEQQLDSYLSQDSGNPPAAPLQNTALQDTPDQIGGHGSRIVNILLVGQDRLEGEGRTRSDSMILCTFNKHTRELILTSFLRDMYVEIPGHGSNRINAAYAFGGMELLELTLERNFGIQVDGTVEVDFSRFSQIVDRLGGVDMELREDEAALINEETGSTLSSGLQHLQGDQALAYSRIRKLDADGDFSRTSRQRKVMGALLDTYRDAKLSKVLVLASELMPMLTTDLDTGEILGYALELFPMLSGVQIQQQYIPASGTFTNQNIDGMAVLVPDLNSIRQLLATTLLGS